MPSRTARRSPVEPGRAGPPEPAPQPVGDAADAASAADDVPLVDVQHDVDPLPAQPLALVEAVLRPARRAHDRERTDHRTLRRRAAERQVELDPFVDGATFEPPRTSRLPLGERPDARLRR